MPIIYNLDPSSDKSNNLSNDPNNKPNISTQKKNTEKDNYEEKYTKETQKVNITLPTETTSSYWINPLLKNIPFLSSLFLSMENIVSEKIKMYLIPWVTFITGVIGTTSFFKFGPELTENLSKQQFINKLSQLTAFSQEITIAKQNDQANLNVAKTLPNKHNLLMTIPEDTKEVVQRFFSDPQQVSRFLENIANLAQQGVKDTSVFDVSLTFNPGVVIRHKQQDAISQNRSNSHSSNSETVREFEESGTSSTLSQQIQSTADRFDQSVGQPTPPPPPPPQFSNNVINNFAISPVFFIGLSIKYAFFRK